MLEQSSPQIADDTLPHLKGQSLAKVHHELSRNRQQCEANRSLNHAANVMLGDRPTNNGSQHPSQRRKLNSTNHNHEQ
jgi:hypothetical protein